MKKSLLFVSALFLCVMSTNAQITITTADIASPTKIIYQANDTMPTVSEGSFGISQTWNMSALNTHTTDTMTFISYGWAPNSNFSTSNLVVKQGWQNNYVYGTNTASNFTIQGSTGMVDFGVGPVTITQINSPSEIVMNFPGMYLTAYTNNYMTNTPAFYFGIDPGIGFVIDSVRQHSEVKKTVLVDAWGSLTTPLGTYNVLRSEETIVRYDTTDAYLFGTWNDAIVTSADSTTGYSWWANGVGFPLVSIKLDSLSNIKQTQWLQALPAVGINEQTNATTVMVYPNPAQNQINFTVESSKVAAIQVMDITGRMIDFIVTTGDNVSINTSMYANGVYSYALVGKENAILNRGKFTIAK